VANVRNVVAAGEEYLGVRQKRLLETYCQEACYEIHEICTKQKPFMRVHGFTISGGGTRTDIFLMWFQ